MKYTIKKHYKEKFIVTKFAPKTYVDWHELLRKIQDNLFLRIYHLQLAEKQWHDENTNSWQKLMDFVAKEAATYSSATNIVGTVSRVGEQTEVEHANYRSQI